MESTSATDSRLSMHTVMTVQPGLTSPVYQNVPLSIQSPPSILHNVDALSGGFGDSSSDSHSPELPTPKASDKDSRIIAEKQRRSQYNFLITQLSSLLEDIVHSQRKVDKISVLRLAATKLRNEHVFGNSVKCSHLETWSSSFMKFFDLFGSFTIAVTCRGRIVLVSPNVQEKLGYCRIDLVGQDLYNYVHHEDKEILHRHIYPPELQTGCDEHFLEQHHNFYIRLMRAGARSDPPRYENCRIDGILKKADRASANTMQDKLINRRVRVRHHRKFESSGNDYVFIGMVHILSCPLPARLLHPSAYTEYWTRHLLDGRIVQCDQSISLAAGYMTEEITGASAFVFMHRDDVRWVICVLRQMYDQSKEFGESYYRLMSRSGHFIYMKTRGFLEIDSDTKKVQSFVCVNTVISEGYGKRMMEEMKKKYSVMIDIENQQNEKADIANEVPVEHPKCLERIVMHLVEPSVNECEESKKKLKLMPPPIENIINAIKTSEKVVQETSVWLETRKRKPTDYDHHENLKRHSGY